MKFLEEQFNINVALNKESEEYTKIKRAQDNWSKVRQKKKVIHMIKNLDAEIIHDLYNCKYEREMKGKHSSANESEGEEYKFKSFIIPP